MNKQKIILINAESTSIDQYDQNFDDLMMSLIIKKEQRKESFKIKEFFGLYENEQFDEFRCAKNLGIRFMS